MIQIDNEKMKIKQSLKTDINVDNKPIKIKQPLWTSISVDNKTNCKKWHKSTQWNNCNKTIK